MSTLHRVATSRDCWQPDSRVVAALYPNVLRGFLARNALVLLLHRTVRPDDVGHATDDHEHVLLVKRAGTGDSQPGAPGDAPSAGDQVIAA